MVQEGVYTQDQINSMGLNFNEVTSAQQVGGQWYKLDNTGDGRRAVRAVQPVGSGEGAGGFTTPGAGASVSTPASINLPEIYKNLYSQSGVSDLEKKYAEQTEQFNKAQSVINDNPFLSEGSRVGRGQKLQIDYNNATAGIQNQIATKKADIETQINLQTKQFDINSQAAREALDQFNTLLSSGALDSASPDVIANITRSTGLGSSAIYSAINAQKAKNVQTTIKEFDDGTNQGFAVINSKTGEIISKQNIAASKPEKSSGSGSVSYKDKNKAVSAVLKVLQAKGKDNWVDWKEYIAAVAKAMGVGVDEQTAQTIVLEQMKSLGMKPYKW